MDFQISFKKKNNRTSSRRKERVNVEISPAVRFMFILIRLHETSWALFEVFLKSKTDIFSKNNPQNQDFAR